MTTTLAAPATSMPEGAVSVNEAAAFLSVSRATIYVLMSTGELEFVRIRRTRRIPRKALYDLITRTERHGA